MPELDGMTAAHRVPDLDREAVILFITNMGQYAIRGYEVDALDFMLKPVSYFALAMKLDKALTYARSRQTTCLVLPQEDGLCRVRLRFFRTGGSLKLPRQAVLPDIRGYFYLRKH